MLFAKLGLAVYNVCIVKCRCRLPLLHLGGRVNSNHRNRHSRIFVVNHKRKGLVKHCNEAACANVTILGNVYYEFIQHSVELLCIVTDLNKSAIQLDRSIFSPNAINPSLAVFLYEFTFFFHDFKKLPRLVGESHIVALVVFVIRGFYFVIFNNVYLFHVIFICKLFERYGWIAFILRFHFFCDFKQLCIGFLCNISFYIVDRSCKYLLRFNVYHSVL